MVISEELLLQYGAIEDYYEPHTIIFREGGTPQFYFQIIKGTLELTNYHEDGKEFTQNILSDGESFGESLLFNNKPYPMNAITKTRCQVLKLPQQKFLQLITQNPEISLKLFTFLSDRLYYKYLMLFCISSKDPICKITTLLQYFKDYHQSKGEYTYQIPLTRQQIANLTGLRVETVIRTVKKLENNQLLKIENGKIYC